MMENEIDLLIKQGEGYLTEFKRGISRDMAGTICSFANAAGGTVIIGADDNGDIAGLTDINRIKSQVIDIAKNCDPGIKIEIENVIYKEKNILLIRVAEGTYKPYQCSEGFYMRVGASTQKMKSGEILDFISGIGRITFDNVLNMKFDFRKHFDRRKYADYINAAGISQGIKTDIVLHSLGVMDGKFMNNAGVLFFAKEPQDLIRQSVYTAMLCKGTDRTHIIDRKEIKGGLQEIVSQVINFVERNTKLAYKFTGKAKRKEIKEYPMEAIREAVINSIAHKYYPEQGHNNILTIYTDRIEIENYWIKPNNYTAGKTVYRRNPIITDLLYRLEMGEKAGSGFKRMKNYCAAEKAPYPKIEAIENYFYIVFKKSGLYTDVLGVKVDNGKEINVPINVPINVQKQRLMLVVEQIKNNAGISTAALAKILEVNEKTIKRDMKKLKKEGIITHVGPNKSGRWEVI